MECVTFGEEYKQTYFLPEGNMVAHGSEIFSLTFLFLLLLLLITSHILVTSVAKICRTGFPNRSFALNQGVQTLSLGVPGPWNELVEEGLSAGAAHDL